MRLQRRKLLFGVLVLALGSLATTVQAKEFYVAPDGKEGNPGTEEKPFGSVEQAQTAASAGDTVYIRGGEYKFSGTQRTVGVAFKKSGEPDRPIRYFAYPGETPIFDLFELKPQQRVTGLDVHCNWIHIRGLEVKGVQQEIIGDSWGVRIQGDHNIIENLNVHHCEAPGVFITSGGSNLVLNTDSHHNFDPDEKGENADGFGCHSSGGDNVLRGCRAWDNSDDGFDFINAAGTCTVEWSISSHNGFEPDTQTPRGNGAGFKSGGFGYPPRIPATGVPRHTVRFNLAFGNRTQGFYANWHPGGIDFFNNTAFNNPANFDMQSERKTSHKIHNNLAAGSGSAFIRFNGGTNEFNSWTLPVTVSNDDFESVDGAEVLAARNADGSLPSVAFMRLVEGSDLIDKGKDLGFEFTGDAPDLGAFERGMEPPTEEPDDTDPQEQDTDTEEVDTDEGDSDEAETDEAEANEEDSDDSDLDSDETSVDIPDDDSDDSMDEDSDSTEDSSQDKKDKDDSADDEEEMDEESMSGEDIDGERESADCGCRLARARDSSPAMLLTILFGAWFWARSRKKAL